MRNETWNKLWKAHIEGMAGLAWIPNHKDSHRVQDIMAELKDIVDRNTLRTMKCEMCGKSYKGIDEHSQNMINICPECLKGEKQGIRFALAQEVSE